MSLFGNVSLYLPVWISNSMWFAAHYGTCAPSSDKEASLN